jgi:hypothetical protein
MGINTHALQCMAGYPHLFEDLRLSDKGEVEGINDKFAVTWDKEVDSNQDPQVTTNQQDTQASQEAEGASPTSTITAGIS